MDEKSLIVALDLPTAQEAKAIVEKLNNSVNFYKVAPSITFQDPHFIPWLIDQGKKVFLDCKWYDIPSQVQRSVTAAGKMGITSCTIHTSGGGEMMKKALEANPRPLLWGVTVLTSFADDGLKQMGVSSSASGQVLRLAQLAQNNNIDGLVCSPQEVTLLRNNKVTVPLITPGIQYGGLTAPDQKRTASPQEAWAAGANYLVIGRSVLSSPDPKKTVDEILNLKS